MKIKKQNLTIASVVLGILAIVLVIVMAMTSQKSYSATCTTCGGTGKCPGVPQEILSKRLGEDGNLAQCPKCKNKSYIYRAYECPICHIKGESWICYSSTCGYSGSTNNHANAKCPDCNGTGYKCAGSHTWGAWECHGIGVHSRKCIYCQTGESESCDAHISATYANAREHRGTCSKCGGTFILENHEWNNGVCKYCGYNCTHNGQTTGTCPTCNKNLGGGTTPTCTNHTGGTHANGGRCTNCGTQYQNHASGVANGYTNITSTTHSASIPCTYPGCTFTYTGMPEAHDWSNQDGVCAKCKYNCLHEGATTGTCPTCNKNLGGGTTPTCTNHTGGTHANGGKCTNCGVQYQNHGKSNTPFEYVETANGHKPRYKCICSECNYIYEGAEEAHDWSNNDGECTKCHDICDHDGATTGTCPTCNKNLGGGTKPSCTNHTGGTHANGGICTNCGVQYQNHGKSNTPFEYVETANGHKPRYKCICSECNYIYEGAEEAHDWSDNNGECTKCHDICDHDGATTGTCPICNKNLGKEEKCEHEYEIKNNDTYHWEQCSKCNGVKNKEKHKFENGKCSVCSYECTHTSTTPKKDDTYHWEVCDICGKEINKEKHSYVDGACECGQKEQSSENNNNDNSNNKECEHKNREWKSSDTEHWQVCKDCGKEIPGTRAKHNNENGTCKDCGLKLGTSTKVLPNTGDKTTLIIAPAIIALAVFVAIRFKKYKED